MRRKGWISEVLREASETVSTWPDWRKSADLKATESSSNGDKKNKRKGSSSNRTKSERMCAPVGSE